MPPLQPNGAGIFQTHVNGADNASNYMYEDAVAGFYLSLSGRTCFIPQVHHCFSTGTIDPHINVPKSVAELWKALGLLEGSQWPQTLAPYQVLESSMSAPLLGSKA